MNLIHFERKFRKIKNSLLGFKLIEKHNDISSLESIIEHSPWILGVDSKNKIYSLQLTSESKHVLKDFKPKIISYEVYSNIKQDKNLHYVDINYAGDKKIYSRLRFCERL